jgi:putative transposase
MAEELRKTLDGLLRKAGLWRDEDVLKEGIRVFSQALMELEVEEHLGAGRYERIAERAGYRNGYREREWDTRVGTIDRKVPRVRDGSYFPSLLDPRKRAERALVSVVQEAYVHGVSTRRVDDLVKALGMQGISKSQVSRLCQELGDEVEQFRCRRLTEEYPYLWMDATFLKVRQDGRVVSQAVVIAIGVKASGEREVLGWDVGPSEDGAFWLQFLRGLKARGLGGVQLVVSDAHQGLKDAIATVLAGTCWQRCRVHFVRNVLALVPKSAAEMVAATIRTVFMQPDAQSTKEQWRNHPLRWVPATASALASPASPPSWMRRRPTSWPTWASRTSTGGKSGPTTRSNDSTARSSGAPTWWASSPTRGRSIGWSAPSWSSNTTSGK